MITIIIVIIIIIIIMVLIKSISVHNALYIIIRKISSLCDILHIKYCSTV